MKNLLVLLLSGIIICTISGQEVTTRKIIKKTAFYDKTIPLRDMKQIPPDEAGYSWENGIIENESVEFRMNGGKSATNDEHITQKDFGYKNTRGPIVNVAGIGNVNGVYPPDTDGEAGPNHYFQMINLSFAIYDKSGNKLYGPVANSTLWQGFPGPWSGHNDGDPIILYDELADRWVASQFAVETSNGKSYQMIAVSETSDPLGSWFRYAFEFDFFNDYPKMSVWPDGYYATFHMFQNGFKGSAFVAFEREKMLTGDPDAQMIYFGEFSSKFGYLPADVDGNPPPSGTPCYFAGVDIFTNHKINVYEMSVDWDNPDNSQLSIVDILTPASFNSDIDGITQPGTGTKLDAMNYMTMFRLPFRTFDDYDVLLANHTVKVGSRTGIRWYEMRNYGSGWEIYQQGTYAPDNDNRWLGSIAMSANGNIALGFSVSGTTTYPSIRYTGRTPDAPAGEMNIAEVEIMAGSSSQSGVSRWGDYSCMVPDPVNDSVFWFTTEYMKNNGWGTRIASFNFENTLPPTAFAGGDDSVCENTFFYTSASALYYASAEWTTSGDGTFVPANALNTKYLRGNQDMENGSVVLTLTTYGYEPGVTATDNLTLTIIREAIADPGNDTTINSQDPVLLNGQAAFYESVLWTTSGDGTFDDPTKLNPYYTLGNTDMDNGEVTLTLTAYGIGECGFEDSGDLMIFYDPATYTGNLAGINNNIKISPNPSNGVFTIEVMNAGKSVVLEIVDLHGKKVFSAAFENAGEKLLIPVDISENDKGVYIIKVRSENYMMINKVVLK